VTNTDKNRGKHMSVEQLQAMAMAMDTWSSTERKKADCLRFATRDEALDYARKLAQLKPGDVVETKSEDQPPERGIFLGTTDDGRRALVLRYDDDQEISLGAYPWGGLRLPPFPTP
jgi:hypothetical protein